MFQFHKGAIRTLNSESVNNGPEGFNSIKVRLELCHVITFRVYVDRFNSIKVRLEHAHRKIGKFLLHVSIP